MKPSDKRSRLTPALCIGVTLATSACGIGVANEVPTSEFTEVAREAPPLPNPPPVENPSDFANVMARLIAEKPMVMERQLSLLELRYDLSNRPSRELRMSRGKPLQVGIRVKLQGTLSWEELGALSAEEIKNRDLFPLGFLRLPHPKQSEGGMIFPKSHIDEVLRQTGRDLTRFDLDFDLPEHFLPEFPSAIFLTTRKDLGDVSKGQLVTTENFFELFNGVIPQKQLDGLRLLVSPFAQQQFNLTDDRRSVRPSLGVSCFDCHANGNTNAGTHLVADMRPQERRFRVDTPTLRGVNIQRLFGSHRALKTVEDFTEFEQIGAYFDNDMDKAIKKGANFLNRTTQVQPMAEFQELLDFPPAPKLDLFGKLKPGLASTEEMRGQDVFYGKGKCASCHLPPYFTDNSMHDLAEERFHEPKVVNGALDDADGPVKTMVLRGLKDTPPYLHDGRLLTIEDTVEYFNLILETKLTRQEKSDLVAFLRQL